MYKALLITTLILGSLAGSTFLPKEKDISGDLKAAAEFVVGILAGFEIDVGEQDLVDCVGDIASIVGDIDTSVKDFKEKTPTGIKAGLKEVGLALENIPNTLNTCKKVSLNQADKINEAISVFESPLSLIYHVGEALVLDGNDIYNDVNLGIGDWNKKDYYESGKYFGEALFKVVQPTKDIMVGLFEGFSFQTNFPDVIKCIEDVTALAKDLAVAVTNFVSGNYTGGLTELSQVLANLPQAISDCKSAADGETILRGLENIKHPLSVEVTEKSYKINGIEIQKEMERSAASMIDNDWRGTFYHVGKLIKKLGR